MKEENKVQEKEKKEDKDNLKKKVKLNNVIIGILILLLLISVIVVIVSVKTGGVAEENNSSNMGLVTSGDDYVFYYKSQVGIVKIKDGEEYTISSDQAYSLAYADGYLYYTTPNSSGGITIKKISHNGDESWTLKDTASSSLKMCLNDGYLYYITSSDDTLSRIDLDGDNEEVLINRTISDFNIVDQTIYFTDTNEFLCKIDLNGENYSKLFENTVCSKFQIYDNCIYYKDNEGLKKIDIETLETELVTDVVNSDIYNVTNKGIFYLDEENLKICKISLDGKKQEDIVDVNTTKTWINIVDDELYYLQTDSNVNSSYKTYRIKINGNEAEEIVY